MISTLLAVPVAFVSQSALADECATGTCMGANSPVMMDVNADGTPDTAIPIIVNSASQWTVDSPWDCGNSMGNNVIQGSKFDSPTFNSFMRYNGYLEQYLYVMSVTPEGNLRSVGFDQVSFFNAGEGDLTAAGQVELQDSNQDNGFDTIVVQQTFGGELSITSNIAGIDTTGDGNADYATFPWAHAATFHNPSTGCGPNGGTSMPQISFPLTDTDGDGIPDSVVLDLDGDNQADPDFLRSPKLQTVPNQPPYSLPVSAPTPDAIAVPTLAQFGLLILSLALAGMGWARARQNISS